ncbi:MAG: hypothetical protein ACTSWD_11660 [Candidatus Heimdallarchaeota archaeon]
MNLYQADTAAKKKNEIEGKKLHLRIRTKKLSDAPNMGGHEENLTVWKTSKESEWDRIIRLRKEADLNEETI